MQYFLLDSNNILFELNKNTSLKIGSGPENDLILVDDTVNYRHCTLVLKDSMLSIIKYQNSKLSVRGRYVNDVRTPLFQNDVITIGRSKFRIWIEKTKAIKRESVIKYAKNATTNREKKSIATQTTFSFFEQTKPKLKVGPLERTIKIEESDDDYDSTATTEMESDTESTDPSADEIENDEQIANESSEISSVDIIII